MISEAGQPYDLTGEARYRAACESLGVVPASYFLRHMHQSELNMTHYGLGPQVRLEASEDARVFYNDIVQHCIDKWYVLYCCLMSFH